MFLIHGPSYIHPPRSAVAEAGASTGELRQAEQTNAELRLELVPARPPGLGFAAAQDISHAHGFCV